MMADLENKEFAATVFQKADMFAHVLLDWDLPATRLAKPIPAACARSPRNVPQKRYCKLSGMGVLKLGLGAAPQKAEPAIKQLNA